MFDEKDKKIAAEREACRLFDAQVADYLEGEDRTVVLAHAKVCAFCGVLLADLQGLMVQSQEMPLVDPPARVWANIRATLAAEGVLREQGTLWERWFSRLTLFGSPAAVGALAALVVLAVGLSVSRNVVGPRPAAVKPAPIATQETVALPAISSEDNALARTMAELESSYRVRKVSFEPAVQATYDRGLDSLNASIQECRDSVQRDPDNSLAREYLLAAYEQKAQVLTAALEYDGR